MDISDGSDVGGERGGRKRRIDCMEVDFCVQAENNVAGPIAWTLGDQ